MKPIKYSFLLFVAIITMLSMAVSACGPDVDFGAGYGDEADNGDDDGDHDDGDDDDGGQDQGSGNGKKNRIVICHKTGDSDKTYVELSLPEKAAGKGHSKHAGDIIPAPDGGCPK